MLFVVKSQDREPRGLQIGKTGWDPQIQFFCFHMGCPPLAYIMGARFMGSGAKVMLAIGYGYSLFDFAIDYCYG